MSYVASIRVSPKLVFLYNSSYIRAERVIILSLQVITWLLLLPVSRIVFIVPPLHIHLHHSPLYYENVTVLFQFTLI